MFDKFTMYADRADFSRVPSPIELSNKEYLIKHPPQYFPKVSYCSGYFGNSFKIEVSIPKILYGNNFFEAQESDFETFLDKLTIQLGKMGFCIGKDMLRCNQSIYNVEIAKNCILGNIPTSVVLENLYRSKPPRPQMKLVGKDWIPGEQVRFIGATHEVTFYDKYLELVMAKRNQFNLDWLFQRSNLKNILRMEIRLKKEQIKQIFGDRPSLEDMFKERYYQKAVQKYWGPIATYLLAHQPYVTPDTELLLYKDAEMNASKMKDLFLVKSLINEQGYHSKAWVPSCGKPRGGRPFQKSGIQRILTNPVYIGKVAHHAKNKIYQGKHEAIVPKDIWEQAQEFICRRIKDKNAFSHYQVHDSVLSRKLYDDTGRSFRLTTAKKQGKKFLYYYNGVGGHYLPVEQLDNFVLKTLKMTDFDDLEPLSNRDSLTDKQMRKWIDKVCCQSTGKTHYLSIFLNEKQIKADLSALPKISGQAEERVLVPEKLDGKLYVRNTFIVDNVSSMKLQNGSARNILTVRQLNESLVRGLARGWQLKKMIEKGMPTREWEKASGMNKRTFARYLNLCYLSPKIVADILEYNNPRNMTLRDLMNLAEGQVDFERQEQEWRVR